MRKTFTAALLLVACAMFIGCDSLGNKPNDKPADAAPADPGAAPADNSGDTGSATP